MIMNHPLTEKILEEFDRKFNMKKGHWYPATYKAFLLSAIKRTANEFRVEEKIELDLDYAVGGLRPAVAALWSYNQCAKETNAKVDSFNPTT